eukprot:518814-Prymnesium_polylepis.3
MESRARHRAAPGTERTHSQSERTHSERTSAEHCLHPKLWLKKIANVAQRRDERIVEAEADEAGPVAPEDCALLWPPKWPSLAHLDALLCGRVTPADVGSASVAMGGRAPAHASSIAGS